MLTHNILDTRHFGCFQDGHREKGQNAYIV